MRLSTNCVSEEISGTTLMVIHIFVITFLLVIYASTASTPGASTPGVVYFPVSYAEYSPWIGFYVTKVKLGNPIKEFTVRINTGSNMFWIACNNCSGCPSHSLYPGIKRNFYNPLNSSTASPIQCSDRKCHAIHKRNRTCSTSKSSSCTYLVHYAPNHTTQGYYVLDRMHHSEMRNSSIIIGCSTLQTGAYTNPLRMFDGFIGLGSHASILLQLSSVGVVPMMFTICLDGYRKNTSYLYFGEIKQSDIAYTPLIPSESHHCLGLQGIYVNGKGLNIDPSLFKTQTMPGVAADSVTTSAFLPNDAYVQFVNSVHSFTEPDMVQTYEDKASCFWTQSSIDDAFPIVQLRFAGGAIMTLYPRNYLTLLDNDNFTWGWCIAWKNSGIGGKTVLGDIVLKDKVLVHDLVNKRFGWKNQECSVPVKFSGAGSSWTKYTTLVISLALFISYSVLFNS